MEVLIGFIAFFASIFGIVYVHFTTRNKERMALIEKGADASLFTAGPSSPRIPINWGRIGLKFGMFMIGIAIGILVAGLLDVSGFMLPPVASYFSMILLFGGLSLVLYYVVERKIG